MQSLTELNGFGATSVEVTDTRPATVVWDRAVFTDQEINITSTSVAVPIARDVVEIINYSTAALTYSLTITNIGSPALGGSTLLFPSVPSGVTVTESPAGTYTVTGLKTKAQWDQIKNPIWLLPTDYSDAELWFVRATVTYYDESLGNTQTFTYDIYDDRFYYTSRPLAQTSMTCSARKIISPTLSFSSDSTLFAAVDVPMIVNAFLLLTPTVTKGLSQNLTATTSISATATLDFTIQVFAFSNRTVSFDLFGRVSTNIKVNWGDGNNDTYTATNNVATHTYASNGTYNITIRGKFNKFRHTNDSYTYTTRVLSWGFCNIQDLSSAFEVYAGRGPQALVELPNYLPSTVTNISRMVLLQANLNDSNITSWNTVNVTNMQQTFSNCTNFNQPIGVWNTSNVTNMSGMFEFTNLNQPINSWNTSKVTNMSYVFNNNLVFNQPLNSWNTSNVTDMTGMFQNAMSFNQSIGSWNTSKVVLRGMDFMFYGYNPFMAFDQNISSWCVFNIKSKPIDFDVNTLASWTTAEKPNWGAAC